MKRLAFLRCKNKPKHLKYTDKDGDYGRFLKKTMKE